MSDQQPITGTCSCGETQYELLDSPMFVHCCHCTWCQRETGSAFALNALIEATLVNITKGHPECVHTPSNSGQGQDITRCTHCKTAIWSNYAAANKAVNFVRVGTLDAPSSFPPDIHIFTSTKQDWVLLDDRVPIMSEYYQAKTVWPEASKIRYKRAIGT
ncbi:MAG: GFA family protein [Agarilytica sp.]